MLSFKVHMPEDLLAAGVDSTDIANPFTGEVGNVRKATVASMLNSLAALNTIFSSIPSEEDLQKAQLLCDSIVTLLPSLKIIGMFDLFSIEEWLAMNATQPTRCLIGLLYLQKYSEEITLDIKILIQQLNMPTTPQFIKNVVTKILNEDPQLATDQESVSPLFNLYKDHKDRSKKYIRPGF